MPAPLITPPKVTASLRLNASAPLVATLPDDAPGRAAVADLQRARADRRPARVGVGPGQDVVPVPILEIASAADHAR